MIERRNERLKKCLACGYLSEWIRQTIFEPFLRPPSLAVFICPNGLGENMFGACLCVRMNSPNTFPYPRSGEDGLVEVGVTLHLRIARKQIPMTMHKEPRMQ